MKQAVTIPASVLMAVFTSASTSDTRYWLNGVCIEPAGRGYAVAVAIYGSRLAAMRFPLQEGDVVETPFTVPITLLKGLKGDVNIRHDRAPGDPTGTVTLSAPGGPVVSAPEVGGVFPPWRRVIPAGPPLDGFNQFNPDDMAAFAKAAKLLKTQVRFAHMKGGVMLAQMLGRDDFVGVTTAMKPDKAPVSGCAPEWAA